MSIRCPCGGLNHPGRRICIKCRRPVEVPEDEPTTWTYCAACGGLQGRHAARCLEANHDGAS